MGLDQKDIRILELLKSNAKLTTNQLSKKTLIPITTIHNRIKKLERNGIIKKYSIELDNKKLGKTLSAYVLATIDYIWLKENKLTRDDLIKKLREGGLVESISMVTGDSDLILKISVKDIEEMNNYITRHLRDLEAIKKTTTLVILSEL